MGFTSFLVTYVAPVFIVVSPFTSYADQIWAIHRTRSSAGFSLDIPLIMLVSSILRSYYWLGAHFDTSLLAQALNMIAVQLVLLRIALDHRPPPSHKGGADAVPFANAHGPDAPVQRPYQFWQWRSPKPYWEFLLYLTSSLFILHLLLSHLPAYIALLGFLALGTEATLPLPQLAANQRARSCRGFRFSVLASWILGDVMKMLFFFLAAGDGASTIPWSFKLCGLFQFACDLGLGAQYWWFGSGDGAGGPDAELGMREKDVRLK
ncbi:MAG: hypothetical protein M1832_002837 [Thelocarpon impressellum]|nr:MAG: hypothetical protein M1832_002837 [Thelocarpon impressellum]